MTRPFIPQRTDELTPEWLTAVLKERGWLKSARVGSAESEILGDGVGFLGVICRLTLELDRDEPTAPKTVIAKLPTAARANRVMAEIIGAYRREILPSLGHQCGDSSHEDRHRRHVRESA